MTIHERRKTKATDIRRTMITHKLSAQEVSAAAGMSKSWAYNILSHLDSGKNVRDRTIRKLRAAVRSMIEQKRPAKEEVRIRSIPTPEEVVAIVKPILDSPVGEALGKLREERERIVLSLQRLDEAIANLERIVG